MPRIFISYRRADSAAVAGRIHDRLVAVFGERNVFKDVDDILPGEDFRTVLEREVSQCDVLLVIIGEQWAAITDDDGRRRLHNPDDFVNIEVESGLKRDRVLVIPVLVSNAPMPSADELPDNLKPLSYRNATLIRNDPDFNRDIERLIRHIHNYDRHFNPSGGRRLVMGGIGAGAALLIILVIILTQSARIFGAPTALPPSPEPTTTPTVVVMPVSLTIAQPVAKAKANARAWSQPDIQAGQVLTSLDPDSEIVIVNGPRRGSIREDTDDQGDWYQVRRPEATNTLGWVWSERLIFVDETSIAVDVPTANLRFVRPLVETRPLIFGDDVLLVQGRLLALGYRPGPLDGYYSLRTKGGIGHFQLMNAIVVTGIVDEVTWAILFSAGVVAAH